MVVPGLRPPATWAFLTQDRRASGWTPSSSAILRIAPLAYAGSASASNAILVARSRSSSGYFFCPMTVILPCHHCLHQTRAGFPLQVGCWEGNKAETTTIIPIVEAFQAAHGIEELVVVAGRRHALGRQPDGPG